MTLPKLTNSSDVALSNLLVCELRDEAGLAYPTVSTQKHLEQIVIVTVCHLTHWRGEGEGRGEEGRGGRKRGGGERGKEEGRRGEGEGRREEGEGRREEGEGRGEEGRGERKRGEGRGGRKEGRGGREEGRGGREEGRRGRGEGRRMTSLAVSKARLPQISLSQLTLDQQHALQ